MLARLIPDLCAGTDLSVANAARRSFNTSHATLTDGDCRLIAFLAREGHTTPFRHVQLSFECEAPVYVARQLGKHQVGMTWSEVSRRYKTEGIALFQPERYRHDCPDRKQGTGEPVHPNGDRRIRELVDAHHRTCLDTYRTLLEVERVCPEQARAVLPQSLEVIWTWTGSLLAWAHLYRLRHHADAQQETRAFARLIGAQIAARLPQSWKALTHDDG